MADYNGNILLTDMLHSNRGDRMLVHGNEVLLDNYNYNQYISAPGFTTAILTTDSLEKAIAKLDKRGIDNEMLAKTQSDWNQTNSSQPDFIKNKPDINASKIKTDFNKLGLDIDLTADTNTSSFLIQRNITDNTTLSLKLGDYSKSSQNYIDIQIIIVNTGTKFYTVTIDPKQINGITSILVNNTTLEVGPNTYEEINIIGIIDSGKIYCWLRTSLGGNSEADSLERRVQALEEELLGVSAAVDEAVLKNK